MDDKRVRGRRSRLGIRAVGHAGRPEAVRELLLEGLSSQEAAALSLAAIQNLTGQAPPGQEPGAGTTVFKNFNRTFQIELPSGWRQIAPNEAVKLSENEQSPALLRLALRSMGR